jgi:putative transposase
MKYNPEIHHRRSIRLQGYDYSRAGLYFITICTQARKCLFGVITEGKMILNEAGKIADECWLQIPEHFPNAFLHEYIVMPNHVHGIIELTNNDAIDERQHNEFQKIIPRSIGSIVRGYKIGVTKWFRNNPGRVENFQPLQARVQNFEPQQIWQRNYYERIIRNEQSYKNISDYIMNNPTKWKTNPGR